MHAYIYIYITYPYHHHHHPSSTEAQTALTTSLPPLPLFPQGAQCLCVCVWGGGVWAKQNKSWLQKKGQEWGRVSTVARNVRKRFWDNFWKKKNRYRRKCTTMRDACQKEQGRELLSKRAICSHNSSQIICRTWSQHWPNSSKGCYLPHFLSKHTGVCLK